ncbi:MAG: cell division protein FtsZ [Flavobacteriales bacterium]|jgi:cell division protein FtsZ|nr:cell division protein FtsZ [Flavobacteriales bacterium]MBK7942588.1 cell division protein FtsZ [Flavobacteriales bacterium]MBK9699009.1 cell division protein FtsZ [Flavobacteriales bacterium]
MKFDLPRELSSIIKVIGVGGGGSNAVNHMYAQGIKGVDFIICNTDKQALDISPVPVKVQLGPALTDGLGAGSIPERGKDAAQENLDELRQLLSARTKMVFITAGMGGGTGTGAAPVIASIARELGILTVGIVTMPFQWEGRKRKLQAVSGIDDLRRSVDTLLVINNDRLRDLFGNLSLDNAFGHADNVLTTAARGIAEIITMTGKVNVDFEDVKTVMSNSGAAIMGMAEAEGEDRALRAAQEALASPLLNDNDIKGAKFVLLNISHGAREVLMDEISEITDHIQDAAGSSADVIWGYCREESLGDRLRVTVIATGFQVNPETGAVGHVPEARKVIPLDADVPTMITQPISNPVAAAPSAPTTPLREVMTPEPPVNAAFEPYLKSATPQADPLANELARPVTPVNERTVELEVTPPAEGKVRFDLYEAPATPTSVPAPPTAVNTVNEPAQARLNPAEHQARVEERLMRMREMTMRLRSPNGINDMEREPAYVRKRIALSEGPRSTDSNVSRYTLTEDQDENGERRVELKRNNPFLHDNVD